MGLDNILFLSWTNYSDHSTTVDSDIFNNLLLLLTYLQELEQIIKNSISLYIY